MKRSMAIAAGAALSLFVAQGAIADGSFQDHFEKCLDQYVNAKVSASVVLTCTAAGGKLDGCTVKENSAPGKGFDKAAMCIAAFLPMGAKTGAVEVPLKFPGA